MAPQLMLTNGFEALEVLWNCDAGGATAGELHGQLLLATGAPAQVGEAIVGIDDQFAQVDDSVGPGGQSQTLRGSMMAGGSDWITVTVSGVEADKPPESVA